MFKNTTIFYSQYTILQSVKVSHFINLKYQEKISQVEKERKGNEHNTNKQTTKKKGKGTERKKRKKERKKRELQFMYSRGSSSEIIRK